MASYHSFHPVTPIGAFYRDWETILHSERIAAWNAAQEGIHREYSDDIDAGAFYALAHLAIAPKGDKIFTHQKEVGALLEDLHARAPEHPGVFHYTIHAYDSQCWQVVLRRWRVAMTNY